MFGGKKEEGEKLVSSDVPKSLPLVPISEQLTAVNQFQLTIVKICIVRVEARTYQNIYRFDRFWNN